MNRQRLLIGGLIAAALLIVAGLVLLPRVSRAQALSGYIEGEPLYLAAPSAGTVTAMYVAKGDEVKAGAALFVVDPQQSSDAVSQAEAALAEARAQALDARKGQRPSEIGVLSANLAAAEAKAKVAQTTYRRTSDLAAAGVASRQQLDDARAAAQQASDQAAAARRQRQTATLGARPDQVRAADARVDQAQAALQAARARLAELAPKAPEAARVEDVFFRQGEWAGANQPILSLLPDARIYVRFFVPERTLAAYRPGRVVRFACDGCRNGLTAKIVYVSPRPEFTPPVIYSRETRDRLVYLVEARPSVRLNPGQPVDVEPLEPER
ncbi:MAG TPA: HlyD family efflux transporter periplasmic adaptor subunit [Phenylobacterium sp.]|uniref:HlyD family secretion protein n=1 Tax=Phenylobacterium sp. TaxID=1871053 RepID=UPI002C6692CC|nr:HlyD family efflux transporter periplasmic adaptor subunit [Phenylobacterium sp.]HSV04487.1 HlyD family efflux transporter periplasmic adaptor subunit [Phenylobacterium sp.]